LLCLDEAERVRGATELDSVAVGIGAQFAGPLLDAFLAALP
jgi:hypothetical protein